MVVKTKLFKTLAATMAMVACMGTTVCAAPKQMADGVMFDPQYYAQSNPDVVAALGTDENILYKHYALYGKAEGRAALASLQPVATQLPAQGEVIAWASDPGDKTVSITGKSGKVYTYSLPTLKGRWYAWGLTNEETDPDCNWELYNMSFADEVKHGCLVDEAIMMETLGALSTGSVARLEDIVQIGDPRYDTTAAREMFYEELTTAISTASQLGAPAGDFRLIEVEGSNVDFATYTYTVYDSNWGYVSIGVDYQYVWGDESCGRDPEFLWDVRVDFEGK